MIFTTDLQMIESDIAHCLKALDTLGKKRPETEEDLKPMKTMLVKVTGFIQVLKKEVGK